MKKQPKRRHSRIAPILVIIGVLLATVAVLMVPTVRLGSEPAVPRELEGYREVKEYNHVRQGEVTCLALTPGCGYCPGKVVAEKCYVSTSSNEY